MFYFQPSPENETKVFNLAHPAGIDLFHSNSDACYCRSSMRTKKFKRTSKDAPLNVLLEKSKVYMFIRRATLDDVPKLAEIHVLAWQAAYADYLPVAYLHSLNIDKRLSDWNAWLSDPGPGTTIVVENSKKVVGFCVFGPARDNSEISKQVGEILALNIHPKFWRCGYGGFLCKEVLNKAQQHEWTSLILWVLKSNEHAKLFYQSLGFKSDGFERIDLVDEGVSFEEIQYSKVP